MPIPTKVSKSDINADLKTFKYIGDRFSYDKKNVYWGVVIVINADPQTIRKTEDGLEDKNHKWKWNREDRSWDIVSN